MAEVAAGANAETQLTPRRFTLGHFFLAIELTLVVFFSLRPAVDPDYGWHIANGQHVFDGTIFGGHDIYSWTATNLWVAHEWATEAVMYIVDSLFGMTGNSIVAAFLSLVTYAAVCIRLRGRRTNSLVLLITLPIVFVGAMRSIGVRPLMLELLYLALLLIAIDMYLAARLSRRFAAMVVMVGAVVWANTHGSFVLLPVVLVITAAELLLSRDGRWADFVAAAGIACTCALLNPWGFRIFEFATQSVASEATLTYIDEWKRPVLTQWLAIPLLLQLTLAMAGISRRVMAYRKERISSVDMTGTLRSIAFGYLALTSGRHVMLFGIAAAEMIALGLSFLVPRRRSVPPPSALPYDRGKSLINVAAAVTVVIAVLGSRWNEISPRGQQAAVQSAYPVGILARIRSDLGPSDKMFNDYRWGGFLIVHGILPVFIDGRSELYGDRQLVRYASIVHLENGWQDTVQLLGIKRVLIPRDSRLARALNSSGWRAIASDSVGVLFERPQRPAR